MSTTSRVRYRDGMGVIEWSNSKNLHHEILPFSHREMSPVDVAATLYTQLKQWPKTKQTWTQDQTHLPYNAIRSHEDTKIGIPEFLKCYQIDKDSRDRYTNPFYCHPIHHTPKTDLKRTEHYLFYARIGNYSLQDVGDIYNIKKQSVSEHLLKNGYSWREEREDGKLTFARTMETIHKWENIPFAKLGRWFDVGRTTLNGWRDEITEPIPDRPHFKR